MKKALKIIVITLFLLLLSLIAIPFVFQDKIVKLVKETINNNVNAKVEFTNANLSLLRNFPNASVQLTNVSVINTAPFKGDTLFYGKNINVALKITDLLKKTNEELAIQSFLIKDAKVNIVTNKNGQANYDIAKKSTENTVKTTENNALKLHLNNYSIENTNINYIDEKSKITVHLTNFNHSGTGDFSQKLTKIDTKTASNVVFSMDDKKYVDNLHLDLNALLNLDLVNMKFSFLKNEAHINQLPLNFDGFVKVNDKNQEINISFKTPSSNFKNFLALVPKTYAKNISDVKTTGNFNVSGTVKGIVDDKHIPKIDVNINSKNASFKFPNLPKSVNNIHINTSIKNTTGLVENTFVTIDNLSFKIDDNIFNSKAVIQNITTNPKVNANVKGKLNLAHIDKVYPLDLKNDLSGIINANLSTKFDVEALQKNIYKRIENNGTLSINDFVYSSKDVVNPIEIKNAEVNFAPTKISLTKFDAKTGTTDLQATGTIDGLLGFLLSNQKLKGNFALQSNEFRVSDFMEENSTKSKDNPNKKAEESLKIPAFLDCTVSANAKKVYYDNLELKNVKGNLILKDEKAILQNVNAHLLDGNVTLNGAVNTQPKTPVFDMKLGVKSFSIAKSFTQLELLKKLAPIASIFEGKLNTDINLKGKLNNDFTPNLATVGGSAFAQMLSQQLNPEKSKAMSLLNNKLNFIDFKKLKLNDIKTHLDFKDGKVNVKPFAFKYEDINVKVGGSHGFDQTMSYNLTLDVPAKYLGKEVTGLLAKLNSKNQNITVPVTATISGNFGNPTVKTDLQSAVKNLTAQLVEQQKNKLIDNALGGLLGGNKTKSDSTKTSTKNDAIKKGVNDILGGLFGKKKKDKKK